MPRCVPLEPDFGELEGEQLVWRTLRDQLPDDVVLAARVGVTDSGVEREVDVLVAWPGVGIAAIEVKGGNVTHVDGKWRQSDRKGTHDIDPVKQAQSARHEFLGYLRRHEARAARARSTHMVVAPFSRFGRDWSLPECPRELLVDHDDMEDLAFRVKRAIETHGAGFDPLDEVAVEELASVLAPASVGQTSLLSEAQEHAARVDRMTLDQQKLLNIFRNHRRLIVKGGAGTGKTWLALEQARRLAESGQRVALVCYSRGLARFLQRITATWPVKERPAYVGRFHALPVEWGAEEGADDDSDYWERRLPSALQSLAAGRSDLFDAVVVDEAQDFGELWWPALLACLRSPSEGGVFVFLDEAQRVFTRQAEVPIELPPLVLEENIRNTKRIAQVFSSLSEEPLKLKGMEGPKVRFVQCSSEAAVGCGDDAVDGLLEDGWAPGDIALLTTLQRHPEQKSQVDMGGWDAYWDAFFAGEDVFYGHVLGFKGLERPAVVLCVNGFREEQRAREMLYVGLSRAQTQLVVCGDLGLIAWVGGEGVKKRLERAEAT